MYTNVYHPVPPPALMSISPRSALMYLADVRLFATPGD